jgi:hypothetical protein
VLGTIAPLPSLEFHDPELRRFAGFMLGAMIISFLIPAVLILFIARRKNWARIAQLALVAIGLAMYFVYPPEMSSESLWDDLSSVLITFLDLVALYWLFFGPGRVWFASRMPCEAAQPNR